MDKSREGGWCLVNNETIKENKQTKKERIVRRRRKKNENSFEEKCYETNLYGNIN